MYKRASIKSCDLLSAGPCPKDEHNASLDPMLVRQDSIELRQAFGVETRDEEDEHAMRDASVNKVACIPVDTARRTEGETMPA
ncbi:MAG: hypothetical protein KGN33_18155 [Paracoccaceae bacterium]|nr:hypothetical protein [Paracoccaceae bacterium]